MKKRIAGIAFFVAAAFICSYGSGVEVGKVYQIDKGKGEVHVSIKSGLRLNIGDRLQVETDNGKVVLEVTSPMLTLPKCKIRGKGRLSQLSKGMRVYRYSEEKPVDDTAVKPGEIKIFGNMEFCYIPGGTYMMGSDNGAGGEKPVHEVTVSSFMIGRYEVTQKQYREIMGKNPSNFKGDKLPVEQVSWEDAMEFCIKFSEKYNVKARLPYEAEWEYAARAGTATAYYWGDSVDSNYLWYYSNSGSGTHPVGEKKPNSFGLYDMSGNVWEWCMDWYDGRYPSKSPVKDPRGAENGEYRVLRGGSWGNSLDSYLRSAVRGRYIPEIRDNHVGFRVVVDS